VFLSHCLLNQNTRYLGGAVCPGVVGAAVDPYVDGGDGLVQMPCPEQRVWGGVLRAHLLRLVDRRRVAGPARLLLPAVRAYVRLRYRTLARRVARDVDDYRRSGLEVVAVVGVAGSPSCGVRTSLDLGVAIRAIGARAEDPPTAAWMRDQVVGAATVPGRGLFVEALDRELRRRGLDVTVREHELVACGSGRSETQQ
jgi:uncharacterized protein YbbK (DUF523 family)